ncbi:hypothetical protein [Catenulispora yoronensis]|uniref:hypothetical protein n=1 Tax=Catenulispora yoronensis TaxID=450799 RepID=UPI0031DD9078
MGPIDPADAARALTEIDRRREQVLRRKVIPAWNWWTHAALIVVQTAAFESGRPVLMWSGVGLFVVCSLAVDLPVSRAARAAAPHRSLAGPGMAWRTLVGLVAFVAGLGGVAVATAFGLMAAKVPHPVTIAAAVAAVAFAVGGQLLVRLEQAVLVRRSAGRG